MYRWTSTIAIMMGAGQLACGGPDDSANLPQTSALEAPGGGAAVDAPLDANSDELPSFMELREGEATLEPANAPIDHLDLGDGSLTFLDEGDGGIGVLAVGSGVTRLAALNKSGPLSAREVLHAMAPSRPVNDALVRNHEALAEAGLVPITARGVAELAPTTPGLSALGWDITEGIFFDCESRFDWDNSFHAFADEYSHRQTGFSWVNVNLVTPSTYDHALGACFSSQRTRPPDGGICLPNSRMNVAVQINSGSWSTLGSVVLSLNEAVYYWRSWVVQRQSRMVVTDVASQCELLRAGVAWEEGSGPVIGSP